MKREVIRVEPLSTYLENWKAPTSAVTRSGDTIYVSGFPPFDPDRKGGRSPDRTPD
jgi:2-iminobutanoate/2-iminopropanoate deaminase